MFKINVKRGMYGFSSRLKGTDREGQDIFMYLDVQFAKCEEPINNVLQIDVKDGFISCFNSQSGVKPKLVILDYDVVKIYEEKSNEGGTLEDTLDELEIPFDVE